MGWINARLIIIDFLCIFNQCFFQFMFFIFFAHSKFLFQYSVDPFGDAFSYGSVFSVILDLILLFFKSGFCIHCCNIATPVGMVYQ